MASIDDSSNDIDFKERLQSQANAFEGLYALTPAREYYGSQIDDGLDPSEQWNRKKQTKEQKRAAKKAKLDPANSRTALDVQQEREGKRKRELGIVDDQTNGVEGKSQEQHAKRQKQDLDDDSSEAKRREKVEKRKEARERKKERKNQKKAKIEARKASKKAAKAEREDKVPVSEKKDKNSNAGSEGENKDVDEHDDADDDDDDDILTEHSATDLVKIDFSGLGASDNEGAEDEDHDAADNLSSSASPIVNSPAFDVSTNHSEISSSSSVDSKSSTSKKASNTAVASHPPSVADVAPTDSFNKSSGVTSSKFKLSSAEQAEAKERLRIRIEELRARRNPAGLAKSRQELLDQRRKKEEQRKAHKKELRRQAKEEEARQRDEQLRGSGSPLSMSMFSPRSPQEAPANNFSFSRLTFADGTMADSALTHLSDPKKQKGPQDLQTALVAAEKRAARLAGYDEQKREDIVEKDRWLHARQRTHGERVARDDTSLLKKALKRKEKQKGKSEREWKDREQAVVKGKEARQKKRETNLARRKDEKGGSKKGGSKGKKKGRPGFEGRFKA